MVSMRHEGTGRGRATRTADGREKARKAQKGVFFALFAHYCGNSLQVPVYEQLTTNNGFFQLSLIKVNQG